MYAADDGFLVYCKIYSVSTWFVSSKLRFVSGFFCYLDIYLYRHSLFMAVNAFTFLHHILDMPHFIWTDLSNLDLWWCRYQRVWNRQWRL